MNHTLTLGLLRSSLLLMALLPVLPLFVTKHLNPLRSFHDEWLAINLGLLASLVGLGLLKQAGGGAIKLPRMLLLPLALLVFIALQTLFLPQVISQHAQMAELYLLWAALLMGLVAVLVNQARREDVGLWVATGLIVAGVCGALLEVILRIKGIYGWWGGVAQTNNYADLLMMGLASVLYVKTVLKGGWHNTLLLMAAIIILGLSLTPSRSVWLYWVALFLLAWRWHRPALRQLTIGLVGYVFLQGLWAIDFFSALQTSTAAVRLYDGLGGAPLRIHIWQVAWQLFLQAPWWGQGFGQFDWAYFQAGQHIPELNARLEHAHNLPLHLLAELGVFPVLLLVGMMGFWLWRLVTELIKPVQPKNELIANAFLVWLLMLVCILGIAAIVLALGDSQYYLIPLGNRGIALLALLVIIGIAIAGVHEWQYTKVEQVTIDAFKVSATNENINDLVMISKKANSYAPLLAPYIAIYFCNAGDPTDINMREQLTTLCDFSYRFLPSSPLVYRQAELQALNGLTKAATNTMNLALKAYPAWAGNFIKQLNILNAEDQHKTDFLRELVAVKIKALKAS